MNRSQQGFTLLELLIAMAIFASLGLGCWRLFEGVVQAERRSAMQQTELRTLQRAVAVIERDVQQVMVVGQSMTLQGNVLSFVRGNWLNPLDQPRSELLELGYSLDSKGTLWRHSRGVGQADIRKQQLLADVRGLSWRLYEAKSGWRSEWSSRAPSKARPMALELVFSVGRLEQIRRVMLLPEGAQ